MPTISTVWMVASPRATKTRFSSTSGTTSATEPSATSGTQHMSASFSTAATFSPPHQSRANSDATLNATAAPQRSTNGAGSRPGSAGCAIAAASASQPGSTWWWSVIRSSMPSAFAWRDGPWADAPQSTVTTVRTPSAASAASASSLRP